MKVKTSSYYKKKCDEAFSKLIREKGYCEWCMRTNLKLDCSHIIPRGNETLRFDPMNAMSMCFQCHMYKWHSDPLKSQEWFKQTYPDRFEYLTIRRREFTKRTKQDYIDLLKNIEEKNIKALMASDLIVDK